MNRLVAYFHDLKTPLLMASFSPNCNDTGTHDASRILAQSKLVPMACLEEVRWQKGAIVVRMLKPPGLQLATCLEDFDLYIPCTDAEHMRAGVEQQRVGSSRRLWGQICDPRGCISATVYMYHTLLYRRAQALGPEM